MPNTFRKTGVRAAEIVLKGGCLCGHVRFEAKGKPGKAHTCSCSMCQKHSGAITVAWVEYPKAAVSWTGPLGSPALFRSSAKSRRAFCPECGSTIGAVDDTPTVGLVAGAFDKPLPDDAAPHAHVHAKSAPEWWHVETAGVPLRRDGGNGNGNGKAGGRRNAKSRQSKGTSSRG